MPANRFSTWVFCALTCGLAGAFTCASTRAWAQASAAPLDYSDAMRLMRARSGSINGAALDYQAKTLQAQAVRRIDGPDLRLAGFAGRVSTTINVDTSTLAQVGNPLLDSLPGGLGSVLPPIPSAISAERVLTLRSLGLSSLWPIYTGGKLDALKTVAAGRAEEAGAALRAADDEASTLLAQRYFAVQLAKGAWQLRVAAEAQAREHQQAAMKLERSGLAPKLDRLKADVAVANAQREAAKARADLDLAERALARLLGDEHINAPSTPLFVHAQPVGSLASFVDAALASNAAFRQIDSKRMQAGAAVKLQEGEFRPTVVGLANYNLNRGSDTRANWLVGVAVSVPLIGRVDRAQLLAAAQLERQRVEVLAEQASRDIPTLAESQWRAMEEARLRFIAMAPAIALAAETLRSAQVAYRNGQATSTDVGDAALGVTKSRLEQTQAAYDYVLALARLLATTGAPDRLPLLAAGAPYHIDLTKE